MINSGTVPLKTFCIKGIVIEISSLVNINKETKFNKELVYELPKINLRKVLSLTTNEHNSV